MGKHQPFVEALRAFIQTNPGIISTLTPEQLAERTGYSLAETHAYYQGMAQEQQRLAKEAEEARIAQAEAEVITYVTVSQKVHLLYYPRLGEVKIISRYQRKRTYTPPEDGWRGEQEPNAVLLSPQDSSEIAIYLSGLQAHLREMQERLATESEPPEPVVPETYIPFVPPPDRIRLADFARRHGIAATQAVKLFEKHLITGERELDRSGWGTSKTVDSVIIYAQGQQDAWEQLHVLPEFHACPQCPHKVEDDDDDPPVEGTLV